MDIDAKLRPIYLINILKERTDEDHYLTTSQLCAILKSEYGIDTHRTTIKSDTPVANTGAAAGESHTAAAVAAVSLAVAGVGAAVIIKKNKE